MKRPKCIYKYCSVETALTILDKRTLRFTRPDEFNDPFEFLPYIEHIDLNEDEYSTEVEQDSVDFAIQLAESCPHRVCCFCSRPDGPLMWSHYADFHRGVVIGFSTANDFFADRLRHVRYSRNRVPIKLKYSVRETGKHLVTSATWQPPEKRYYRVLTTKNRCWRYEEEWRLIVPAQQCKKIAIDKECGKTSRSTQVEIEVAAFPQECVVAVVTGVNCSPEGIERLRQALTGFDPKGRVFFRKAQKATSTYKIAIPGLKTQVATWEE
jgi:hypothetical protein